jgi:deoxycytidine triphosphate deaminase
MVLNGRTIGEEIARRRTAIEPPDPNCIQPASVAIYLDKKLIEFETRRHPFYTDVKQDMDDVTELVEIGGKTSLDFNCRKGLWFTWVVEQAEPMASRYFKDFRER